MAMQKLWTNYAAFMHTIVRPGERPSVSRFDLLLAGFLTLPLWAGSALAGTFTPPEGCTGTLTVQMVGCTVSNHYTCAGDVPGDKWRADFGQNGKVFESRINYEAEWLESINFNPDSRDVLEAGAADPASLTDLLALGRDTYDFTTISDDGKRKHVSGTDSLTGETVVIDGVSLKRTQFDATATLDDGAHLWHAKGNEFVDEARRIFVSGKGTWAGADNQDLPYDSTPLLFMLPGDNGFFSTTPLFDCDATLSALPGPTLISARGE